MNRVKDFARGLDGSAQGPFGPTGRSDRKKPRTIVAIACTAVISIVALNLVRPSKILANDDDVRTFTVDVAFRNPYFQNNVDPAENVKNASAFSPGDTFIQDGSIYPERTILDGKTDFDPETSGAIGTYRARGTWTTDLATYLRASTEKDKDADPAMAFATELFSFHNDRRTILTDGPMPNAYFSTPRVVLGGTGGFREIVGEVHEENIGENKLGYCNLRVTFKIRRVGDARWR